MSAYSRSIEAGDKANAPVSSSVGTSAEIVQTFDKECRAAIIQNRHASQNLLFSFDEGVTFETIGPFGGVNETFHGKTLRLKGSAASTTYDVRTTEAQ